MFPCLGSEGGTQGLGLTVQEVYTELHQQHLLNTSFTTANHPKTCLLFAGGGGLDCAMKSWILSSWCDGCWPWRKTHKKQEAIYWVNPVKSLTPSEAEVCSLLTHTQRSYLVSLPPAAPGAQNYMLTNSKGPFSPWPPGVSPQHRFLLLLAIQLKTKADFQLNL